MQDDQQDIIQLRQDLQQAQSKVQMLRTEFYRRRREALPPAEPEQSIQPGQSDERTKLQEALDMARKIARIYETELRQMATSATHVGSAHRPSTAGQQRGCLLTGWLTLNFIACVRYLVTLPISGLSIIGFIVGFFIMVLFLIGNNALWNLQRWGYYFLAFLSIVMIIINMIIASSAGTEVAAFIASFDIGIDLLNLVVLSVLVFARWKYLE